jgi:hypothetical protein
MLLTSLTLLTFRYDACDSAINQLYKGNKFLCAFILRLEKFTKPVKITLLVTLKDKTYLF